PEYIFPRDYLDNNCINLQHYLTTELFGYLLHPDIPPERESQNCRYRYRNRNRFYRFKSSSSAVSPARYVRLIIRLLSAQRATPSQYWPARMGYENSFPARVGRVSNIFHVRNVVSVLSDEEIVAIVSKLFKLLRPGGYFQWGEMDIHSLRIDEISGECSTAALEEIVRITRSADSSLGS
ncbi:hypothetical protein BO85DRAFT_506052, partial [Aspergillus piperis CBS 112811]